jgi:two-component system, LytTR family, response regulator
MKIQCMIVDDEPLAVQLLQDYIRQTDSLQLAHACYNALEALQYLKQHAVDVIFLDINMPKLTGMELTDLLPAAQKVIFTTAYAEYAVASYEKNAVDYLLKPITYERFLRAIEKITAPASSTPQRFIKSGKSIVPIQLEQVLYIEGLKDYVAFHTITEKTIVYKRMKELELQLPPQFIRIHHSYFINKTHITKIESQQVFAGDICLPVSEKYRESFFEKIKTGLL